MVLQDLAFCCHNDHGHPALGVLRIGGNICNIKNYLGLITSAKSCICYLLFINIIYLMQQVEAYAPYIQENMPSWFHKNQTRQHVEAFLFVIFPWHT